MFEFLTNLMSGGSGTTTIGPGSMSHMSPDQWGTQVQNPSGGGGVGGLLADPNIQSLMAGIGAGLAPEGVGGAVGKATQGMIQNKQMGKAMEKQDKRWQALIDAMAGGKVGKATLKEDPKGGTTITLGAPEGGLGSLDKPLQPAAQPAIEASPFSQYMNNMQSWFQKFGGM